MNNLIGISGKAGSGKDLVYTIIKDLFPEMNWGRIQFADKLKDMVCLLLNCSRAALEDREFKEKELGEEWWVIKLPSSEIIPYLGDYPSFYKKYDVIKLTPRLLLQLLGTDCGRKIIHPDIWVNSTMAEYKPLMTGHIELIDFSKNTREKVSKDYPLEYPNWIITDVRFPNEAKAVKDRGGILIRINRPGFENTGDHLSEIALDDYKNFDTIIINDGTIEDLSKKIKEFLL